MHADLVRNHLFQS